MAALNGRSVTEASEISLTDIKEDGKGLVPTFQQFATQNLLPGVDLYVGTSKASYTGSPDNSYFLANITTTGVDNDGIIHRIAVGHNKSERYEEYATGGGVTKTEHAILILDSIGVQGKKASLGIAGFIKVNTTGDEARTGAVEGVLNYQVTEKNRFVLEVGYADAARTTIDDIRIIDTATGETVADQSNVEFKSKDAYNFQKLTLKHELNKNVTLNFSLNREHEKGYLDLWPEREEYYASVGADVNLGPVYFTAEQAIGSNRFSLTGRYKNLNVSYSNVKGTETYEAGLNINKDVKIGVSKDSNDNYKGTLSTKYDVSESTSVGADLATSGTPSAYAKYNLLSFKGFKDFISFWKKDSKENKKEIPFVRAPLTEQDKSILPDQTKPEWQYTRFEAGVPEDAYEGRTLVDPQGRIVMPSLDMIQGDIKILRDGPAGGGIGRFFDGRMPVELSPGIMPSAGRPIEYPSRN